MPDIDRAMVPASIFHYQFDTAASKEEVGSRTWDIQSKGCMTPAIFAPRSLKNADANQQKNESQAQNFPTASTHKLWHQTLAATSFTAAR